MFMKYHSSGSGLWPASECLSWNALTMCGLPELRAFVYCQIRGSGKAQGEAGCPEMGPPWEICGLGGVESQGDTVD